ncbi:MAG: pilus assembly protein TadG-related protein [Pirellulales bacterium]
MAGRRQDAGRFRGERRAMQGSRRGGATLWIILLLPILLILLGIIVEIGNLWLSRQQLENSLEAASSAAVFRWFQDGGGDTNAARTQGADFASYNWIAKNQSVTVDVNYNGASTNDNAATTGSTADILFGSVSESGGLYTFDATIEPTVFAGNLLIEAIGDFDVASMAPNGLLRFTYSSPVAAPHTWVIREIEVNLRAGTDLDASFAGSPPYSETLTNVVAPSQTFFDDYQPMGVAAFPAPVARFVFSTSGNTASDFDPGTLPTPDVYEVAVRTQSLDPANTGDNFGNQGVVARVTFHNLSNSSTFVQDYVFVDDATPNQSTATATAIGSNNMLGVRVAMAASVPSVFTSLFGSTLGPYPIKAESVSILDTAAANHEVLSRRITTYNPAAIATSP